MAGIGLWKTTLLLLLLLLLRQRRLHPILPIHHENGKGQLTYTKESYRKDKGGCGPFIIIYQLLLLLLLLPLLQQKVD